jgi:hypothetical protein
MSTKRSTRRNANIISESESNTEEISDNNGVSSDKAATAPATATATATHSSNPAKQSPVRRRRVPRPQFVFFRSLSLADFITLGNAACGELRPSFHLRVYANVLDNSIQVQCSMR